jgi:PAS domain S-box-containing protein
MIGYLPQEISNDSEVIAGVTKAILDTSLDAIILMDDDGHIRVWNAAAERLFGWRSEEVIGIDLASCIIPERLRGDHYRGLAHLRATGEGPVLGKRLELPALRRNGSEFPVELSINRLPGVEGLFVGYIRDISERKAFEFELAERARLSSLRADIAAMLSSPRDLDSSFGHCCRLLVDHLDAAFARIWTLEPDEDILVLRASAGMYTHLDGPHGRVRVGQFKIGRIADRNRALLTNDVTNDPNISDPEWARREGMTAFAGYPLTAKGQVRGVLAIFSRHPFSEAVLGDLAPIADAIAADIDRRAGEAALLAQKERAEIASRAKDDFLAALSHELRTPLTPILMTAMALRDDDRLPADARHDLGMIERNITLEARLIDDLLDLTAISKGKLQLRQQMCDFHSLIGLATDIVRDEAQRKPVSIQTELYAKRAMLLGDPSRLEQVIWNLLRNAIKFSPPGGRITIRSKDVKDDHLCIEVSDNGVGISLEALEAIFQPFEQGPNETSHPFGGLGLGLAIARAIVDLHGGTIRAASEGPGSGATFSVEFPGASEQAVGASIEATESSGDNHDAMESEYAPMHLLLVEDHEPTLTVLSRLLGRAGHQIRCAKNIAEAVSLAKLSTFDVVVSDLGLPDGTGVELFEQLRAIQPELRGVALSGYGMEGDLRRSEKAGFSAHLVKPVDMQRLRRVLRDIKNAGS